MGLKKKNTEDTAVLTPAERDAIREDENYRNEDSASMMERLQLAVRVVSQKFNLDDEYRVTKFNDKGKVVDLTLENGDFVLSVTIKNSEAHGMYIPAQ